MYKHINLEVASSLIRMHGRAYEHAEILCEIYTYKKYDGRPRQKFTEMF